MDRGTECIKSPEMLTISAATDAARPQYDRRKRTGTNSQSDVWSLGCLLYELIVGEYLFRDEEWSRFYVRLTGRGQVSANKSVTIFLLFCPCFDQYFWPM